MKTDKRGRGPAIPAHRLGLLCIEDLAREVPCYRGQINHWIATGVLPWPKIKHGTRTFWKQDQLPELLQAILDRPRNFDAAIRQRLTELKKGSAK